MALDPSFLTELKQMGWFVPEHAGPIGSGGGADVYLGYRRTLVEHLGGKQPTPASGPSDPESENGARLLYELHMSLRGRDPALAAIKIPRKIEDRTVREIEAMQSVEHPNLIRVIGVGRETPPAWFALEYFPRGSLQDHADSFRGDVDSVLRGMLEITHALAALHEKDWVHRDVKPGNIFLADDGRWILGDLGIVFTTDGPRMTEGVPEMLSRDWVPDWVVDQHPGEYGPEVDIFMLAKTGYYLLSGRKMRVSQIDEPQFDLRQLLPGVSGISRVFAFFSAHLTLKEHEMANRTAAEFAENIENFLGELTGKSNRELVLSHMGSISVSSATEFQDIRLLLPQSRGDIIVNMRATGNGTVAVKVRRGNIELEAATQEIGNPPSPGEWVQVRIQRSNDAETGGTYSFGLFSNGNPVVTGLLVWAT